MVYAHTPSPQMMYMFPGLRRDLKVIPLHRAFLGSAKTLSDCCHSLAHSRVRSTCLCCQCGARSDQPDVTKGGSFIVVKIVHIGLSSLQKRLSFLDRTLVQAPSSGSYLNFDCRAEDSDFPCSMQKCHNVPTEWAGHCMQAKTCLKRTILYMVPLPFVTKSLKSTAMWTCLVVPCHLDPGIYKVGGRVRKAER